MPSITGSQFLNLTNPVNPKQLIHRTWKTYDVPKPGRQYVQSWESRYPLHTHVLWNDADNLCLVELHYPEFLECYNAFPLSIMRVDFVRLLYLHRYGGLYADVDYECIQTPLEEIDTMIEPIAVVRSPFILCEVMQNSLMRATRSNHPFWYAVCCNIREAFNFTVDPVYLQKTNGKKTFRFFTNKLISKAAYTLYVCQLTGSSMLDKTLVLHPEWVNDIKLLDAGRFFGVIDSQPECVHHHKNSWVDIPNTLSELIALGVGLLIGMFLLGWGIAYVVARIHLKKKNGSWI